MGLLSALRDRLRSLLGRPPDATTPDATTPDATTPDATTPEPAYACAVCGTPVDDPDGECPLCRSTDVVPAGERPNDDAAPRAREIAERDDSRTVGEVLGGADVLAAYDEHWERHGSAYRVTLPDGTTSRVDSTDDLRRTLFREYGPPGDG